MKTTSDKFDKLQASGVRPITYDLQISFDKVFDSNIDFFILSSDSVAMSLLDGDHVLVPIGGNIITEWDKYLYHNYKDRVVDLEWEEEMSLFTSITSAMADITLNNYDGLFSFGSNSPLAPYLLPRRPLRILAGFGNDNLPSFIGITENAPKIDKQSATASLHAIDFLRFMFDKKLDRTQMITNQRVDEILADLFSQFGVLPDQMNLDVAMTTVPFAFFEKDRTLGSVVEELMKAEMGSLYMDNNGIIVFKNRLRLYGDPVITLDKGQIISYESSDESQIINSVSVKADVRVVQPKETVFNLAETIYIPAGQTVTKFFEFQDPVTSVDTIEYYTANSNEVGDGTDLTANLDIVSQTNFGTTLLVEMENTGGTALYVTAMSVYGTPAKVVRNIDYVYKDQDSIDKFEEQTYEVTSPYIQNRDTAESIALTLVEHFKDYGDTIVMTIKSQPALQLNDLVTVSIDDIYGNFRVTKIANSISDKYEQTITAQRYDIPHYFILSSDSEDRSLLDSEDVLAA